MRKTIGIFLIPVIILVSCSSAPTSITTVPEATPTPRGPAVTSASTACTLLHFPVTPEAALGAEFEGRSHVSGPADAPVTIIAFSDYQCLQCAFLAASLKQIRLNHPNDVRLIYFHAPQTSNDKDDLAIQAVEAADLQGKFWEMHDLLFEKQNEWFTMAPADFETWAVTQAEGLGMNPSQFQTDFGGTVVEGRLQQAIQSVALQPFASPRLYVNSTSPYTGLADFASLDTVVRMDALVARQFSACPPNNIDPLKQYIITLHTTNGDVAFQLYPEKAPLAVNNFVFLARSGWYDGITFYRVLPGDRVMSGDPSDTGMGNPGYLFETEIAAGLSFNQAGMLAMDNDGPGTNGSRFFITLGSNPQLNGQYTIIGQVLSGLNILSALAPRNPQPGSYLPPGDELVSVSVEER
ncbi:MAG: peptidylprolyl isomerase [Anaerolineales bacterium]|jgi:cyclophilin family peptidyl-prolyl cis-trans isomerase/protein-disulfide isomerase